MADDLDIENSLVPMGRQSAKIILEAGYLLMDLGKMDEAREVFVGAGALMPKSEVPQLALGTLQLANGQFGKALQTYRVAQRLAPGSGLPRAHAGEALLFLKKDDEALKELNKALELDSDSDGGRFARALIDAQKSGAFAQFVNGNLSNPHNADDVESRVK